MSRIINPDSAGKERKRLTRAVVIAIREYLRIEKPGNNSRDIVAYVSKSLIDIFHTVDVSVTAWEKRGYWIKADRFRMDWIWSERLAEDLKKDLDNEDWPSINKIILQLAQRLNSVHIPTRYNIDNPWVGAWDRQRNNRK